MQQTYFLYPTCIEHESLQKLSNSFNVEYLRQFFIKSFNQGQFQNPHYEQISKMSPTKRSVEKLPEIFKL